MDPLLNALGNLGLGVATNYIYDVIKRTAGGSRAQMRAALQNELNLRGVTMSADTVINALVSNGLLTVAESHLYGKQALAFGSVRGGAILGSNSSMGNARSATVVNGNGAVVTQGNAQVRHNPDGSITFHVGDDGNIKFFA